MKKAINQLALAGASPRIVIAQKLREHAEHNQLEYSFAIRMLQILAGLKLLSMIL